MMDLNKKIFVTRASMPDINEYIEEIRSLWDSHFITNMGEKHDLFKHQLKEYLGVKNLELVVNGHMSLELTIQAMELEGEIITSPFTFASTTHAIVRNNIRPVFCDINSKDYTIDVEKLEKLITSKTSAILPVHVYGNVCDVEGIEEIAYKYGLKVIYDAAHAFGETYKGKKIASFGDASCFSFHATKVFNTIEGGGVSFKENKIGKKLYELKNFGIKGTEEVIGVGANAKLNEFCAAMGICNLRHIDEEIKKRKSVYERYIDNLGMIKEISVNVYSVNQKPNYAYFPITVFENKSKVDRDVLYDQLLENGIFARKYFYPITTEFDCYKDVFTSKDTPEACKVSKRILCLPIYADLELEEVDRICDIIKRTV